MPVLITYTTTAGVYAFTTTGRAAFSQRVQYDPEPATAKAQRQVVLWTVKQEFAEQSFADNQARYAALREALRTPEGMLLIQDENGSVVASEQVRVVTQDLPEQWGQYLLNVDVQFRAVRTGLKVNAFHATFTPAGGTAITLPNVASLRDGTRTERPSTNADNRRETTVTYNLSGSLQADATLPETDRRAALLAAKASILSIRGFPNGTLAYGTESHVVRVEQVDAVLADTAEQLTWSVVAGYREFPDGADVEVEYEVSSRQNEEASELLTAVQGRVMARSRAAAEARAAKILAQYGTGRVLLTAEDKVALLDGADGADGWLALTFNYSYRESLAVISYSLTVSDRDDLKSANLLTSYAGKVTAADASSALSKARMLGDGKYPLRLTANESIETRSVAGSVEYFVQCSFSYEYQRKGAKIYAEVKGERGQETFGANVEMVSGFVAASTEALAEAAALGFQLVGRLLQSQRMSSSDIHQETDTVDQHVRVDFSFSYYLTHLAASVQYTREDARDYEQRTYLVTYSGTAWGPSEAACDTLIDTLTLGETGDLLRDTRTTAAQAAGVSTGFLARNFSVGYSRELTAAPGEDILEAEYEMEITYSINTAVFTGIPFGVPFMETGISQTPATMNVSGSVTAITEASARLWGVGKRALLAGYQETAPRVRMRYRYARKSGTRIILYACSFQFSGMQSTLLLT